ncbi:hypothetical protein EV667_0715 [Ancylobacter aquaticus]|uniref:Uncharacterized protein n=1 Tax=Ancylobacter aquaticus TaxID=100 RepID=A0A4R1IAH7_ANCAQ|nr:hypothetical protein [Ancylobacter aquaticus]TCK30620.1 hypothetical protein EV667_0715 [Ancylobacter aquaticus]
MPSTFVILTMSLAGCQTAQLEHQPADHMRPIVGMTMAEFSRYTGLTPVDQYDIEGGRLFVLLGQKDIIAVPGRFGAPGLASAATCRILLVARPIGDASGASNLRIDGVQWIGECTNSR